MDQDISHASKTPNKSSQQLNPKRSHNRSRIDRHEKYPNGYIEEWDNPKRFDYPVNERSDKKFERNDKKSLYERHSVNHSSQKSISEINKYNSEIKNSRYDDLLDLESVMPDDSERKTSNKKVIVGAPETTNTNLSLNSPPLSSKDLSKDSSEESHKDPSKDQSKDSSKNLSKDSPEESPKSVNSSGFIPVSIILSTQNNLLLNNDNGYEISFSTGVVEGGGVSINETGNIITFKEDGSYRFEISGEAVLFSDVDVNLIYYSDKFSSDIEPFSVTKVPKDEGKLLLRGIPTILPLQKNQTIVTKLIPSPDESIVLMGGTRLLIHNVA